MRMEGKVKAGALAASGSRSNGTLVVARFRPLNATGPESKSKPCVSDLSDTSVTFSAENERDNQAFTFDKVFGPTSTQVRPFRCDTSERPDLLALLLRWG